MAERHSLLAHQVQRFLGGEDTCPPALRALLDAVDETYRQAELERRLAEQESARLQVMGNLGHLVGSLAHEVRNPLFAISGIVEALLASCEDGRQPRDLQRSLEILKEPVGRLFDLMSELLEYGKPLGRDLCEGSLNEVVVQAVTECQSLADQRRVRLVTSLGEPELVVRMIRPRLLTALGNLVQNALQHTPPGGSVAVALELAQRAEDRGWARCVLRDSGSGFRPEDLGRVFEPFFTRRRGGTGLGLSIVRRIVEEHLGRVTADNRPGGGAVVAVELPLARAAESYASAAASPEGRKAWAPGR